MTTATKATHTPGPWTAVFDADGDHAIQGLDALVAVTSGVGYVTSEEDAANARLISQAPEMLRLLELWDDMRLVEFDSNENTVLRLSPAKWHEVREVIRRARGGE